MNKVVKYADAIYNCMGDVDDILQIEGPIETNSLGLYGQRFPCGYSLIEEIDDLPNDPKDYIGTNTELDTDPMMNFNQVHEEDLNFGVDKEQENKVIRKTLRNSIPVFGLRSCLFAPRPTDITNVNNKRK